MNFEKTKNYIEEKIKELNLPYFKCIAKKDKKTFFSYKYAIEDESNNLLNMYSMSKVITSSALLILYERGLVNLNDEVSKYLDGYENLKIMNTNEKVHNKITIHNLLTMTSGLDYNLCRKAILDLSNTKENASTPEYASKFATDGLLFEPGTRFNYSLSLDVVAAIVEKVSGQRFSDFVYENIFRPLGMNESTFKNNLALSDKCREDYAVEDDKLVIAKKHYKYFAINKIYESGGAGLISSVDDYSKFADSLANRSNEFIDDKTVDLMDRVYVKDTPFCAEVQEYSKSSVDYGYGYGVRVRKIKAKEGMPVGEFGWDGAAGSYCLIDRENHISIVIGLTIQNWPNYVKDLHIKIVGFIYEEMLKNGILK